ncbi:MAG TPA: PASTA domain-containing protein [Gemmatimonadales bacterium]|nr:PASTA domain-containing protein [Gemmatimonadales bacterium]
MRRHTESPFATVAESGAWRRFARDIGLVVLTFAVGYAVSSYYITPSSASDDDHAVPRVLGQPLEQARTALANAGFRVRAEGERPSPTTPRGAVLWQDPPPGMVIAPNSIVQLVLSAGPAPVTVPDVIGLAAPYAERVVEAAGLKVGRADTVRGGGAEAGVVVATRPSAGNGRPRGTAVDLVVSGPAAGGL